MGCQTSKVTDENVIESLKQATPEDASLEMTSKLASQTQMEGKENIQPLLGSAYPVCTTPSEHNTQHNPIEMDRLLVKIRDPMHPFAITLSFLSKFTLIETEQAEPSNQASIIECEGVGHDMSLIRYICSRWHVHLLHLGLCKAIVDESICTTQFRLLPSIETIHRDWLSFPNGDRERINLVKDAMRNIVAYVDYVKDLLQLSPFMCNDALSLADIFAASCLMPIISLRAALNRLPLDILLSWTQRIGIYQPMPAEFCHIVIVSDNDEIENARQFGLPIMLTDVFFTMSNMQIEKCPCLIKCQDDKVLDAVHGWISIQADLESNCSKHTKDAKSFVMTDVDSVQVVLYLCSHCSAVNCFDPEHIALLFFLSNINIRLEISSGQKQSLVCFRDGIVTLTETPAILRYLTRTQRETVPSKLQLARIDDNITWISQKLVPAVQSFLHNTKIDKTLLELSLEHAVANLCRIESDILTADYAYLAAVAFCLQKCSRFNNLQLKLQNAINSWFHPVKRRSAVNMFSLLQWQGLP